jgi:RND family efflux transporter MFP subunit
MTNPGDHSTLSDSSHKKPFVSHKLRLVVLFLLFVCTFLGLLVFGFSHKSGDRHEVAKANDNLETLVTVARPHRSQSSNHLTLPGELNPYLQTEIYSRTSGTLKQRYVDIGDHVRSGQLLAMVDVPEIDQELAQAKAALAQAVSSAMEQKTRVDLAKITWDRWQKNAESGGVSQQDVDQRKADYVTSVAAYKVSQAVIAQNQANIRRIIALQDYKQIRAPFSGVITSRTVDAGANIVAGGSTTSTHLFTIAQMDRLRIFINVPQANVDGVRVGLPAVIHLPERPNKTYPGHIARMSQALDAASRTMRTEVDLPNPGYQLSPGRYTQVSLSIPQSKPVLLLPNTVLVIDADGTRVVAVQPDQTLHYKKVVLGRDNGEEVALLSGVAPDDVLVTNPTDSLKEGQKVKILATKAEH